MRSDLRSKIEMLLFAGLKIVHDQPRSTVGKGFMDGKGGAIRCDKKVPCLIGFVNNLVAHQYPNRLRRVRISENVGVEAKVAKPHNRRPIELNSKLDDVRSKWQAARCQGSVRIQN